MLKLYRLTQVVDLLGGAISLPSLKKYCHEGRIDFTTSLLGGVRYLSEEQISALFLTIKRKNNT
jgi:predicted site-specific integrase-resolvase